ncbi:LysM peptidoglycan-binding domain-containing protein [Mycobacterium vicinigordonae]|uniref:LysM peptidoglycan-binding domain-containing protein n=1 Tax=Mycobacterium vicinigordonae TaxID=1719132 RepID=A0A7D6I9T1_9MYCO|nr:LysM peptidoglycan-binding domain-containing protein [Mycobacterium vicinigordonae]QLL09356.1 LysM peptidoglycan-binding domain-containing protein [Mycobacterium vicinigordonae]
MTLIYAGPYRNGSVQSPLNRPVNRPKGESSSFRAGRDRSVRPGPAGPARPAGAPMRYYGTGVARSTATHRRRPVGVMTTIGLALLAGVITLWLGLMANFGSMVNGDSTDSAERVPSALAVVRVEPGESLQDLAARVAPGAPVHDVVERIRDLNALDTGAVSAGQTLIAPVG